MHIVLAFDSFKGTLDAATVCRIARESLETALQDCRFTVVPMADGGEGTLDALTSAADGTVVSCSRIAGPLPGQQIDASYGWLASSRTAVIEMARASGLPLVPPGKRNPLITTTRGTGQLIAHACRRGAERILLTLGGSATCDGGTGAARALGWGFLDARGRPLPEGGGPLRNLAQIVHPPTDVTDGVPVEALCDVDNPLCGARGAAAVYGPQKGATPAMVHTLDAGLKRMAAAIQRFVGTDVLHLPGAGAAGGFGAGAVAFLGADLVPGIEAIIETTALRQKVRDADWVITGEGALDAQSLQGKVVSGILRVAQTSHARVAVVCGTADLTESAWREAGISAVEACKPDGMALQRAMENAEVLLRQACTRLAEHIAP